MITSKSITVHGWLPDLNSIALGIGGAGAVAIGSLLGPLLFSISWRLLVEGLLGITLLTFALAYCRVTVTPYEVRVLGSGLWKSRYKCPLEEAAIHYRWLLPELAAQADYYSPCLDFSVEEDWDTGVEYVEISFYNEQLLTCFRQQQFTEIVYALRTMAEYRTALEDFAKPTPDHA